MSARKQSGDVQMEECPFCGKPFKRLKSHLPHCKMALAAQRTTTSTASDHLHDSRSDKHTVTMSKTKRTASKRNLKVNISDHTDDTLPVNPGTAQKSVKSKLKAPKVVGDKTSSQSSPAVYSTSLAVKQETENVGIKRLEVRERELERRNQFISYKQNENKPTSETNLFQEALKEPKRAETIQTDRKTAQGRRVPKFSSQMKLSQRDNTLSSSSATSKSTVGTAVPSQDALKMTPGLSVSERLPNRLDRSKRKSEPKFWEYIEAGPEPQRGGTFGLTAQGLVSSVPKTSVWDHIKEGLYNRRSRGLSVVHLTQGVAKVASCDRESASALLMSTRVSQRSPERLQADGTEVRSAPVPSGIHTPTQSSLSEGTSSRTQRIPGMEWASMLTGDYQFPIPHTERALSQHVWAPPPTGPSPPPLPLNPGPLSERHLGDVRLNELADWLISRTPLTPREGIAMLNRGWQWYYRRYIDVRKGGIGGISMLIAGYCVLSYMWSYPHLKKDRWRKYH
ncbi:uncharacterized protein DDB_G0284459 [Chanos chanos]|uniref:Uncharacterized protein DDB_G0284459 n=1 Tax=Chanos chanos TaxID=29144 RepID=A0A6J2VHX1_CHACN|nr:uncharacterized protein DDB_G0284459-like [Chanos chanos]